MPINEIDDPVVPPPGPGGGDIPPPPGGVNDFLDYGMLDLARAPAAGPNPYSKARRRLPALGGGFGSLSQPAGGGVTAAPGSEQYMMGALDPRGGSSSSSGGRVGRYAPAVRPSSVRPIDYIRRFAEQIFGQDEGARARARTSAREQARARERSLTLGAELSSHGDPLLSGYSQLAARLQGSSDEARAISDADMQQERAFQDFIRQLYLSVYGVPGGPQRQKNPITIGYGGAQVGFDG